MIKPYMIQKITMNNVKGECFIDDLFSYDYMRHPEFEFGALFKALGKASKNIKDYKLHMCSDIIHRDGRKFCIIYNTKTTDINKYIEFIKSIIQMDNKEYHCSIDFVWNGIPTSLIEPIDFSRNVVDYKNENKSWPYCDTWWDLDNNVIFHFGKKDTEKILKTLKRSTHRRNSRVTERMLTMSHMNIGSSILDDYNNQWQENFSYEKFRELFSISLEDPTVCKEDMTQFLFCWKNDQVKDEWPLYFFDTIVNAKIYFNPVSTFGDYGRVSFDITNFCKSVRYQKIIIFKKKGES